MLQKIRTSFAFLVTDFSLSVVAQEQNSTQSVVTYKNQFVQVECAASEGYFHAVIRRIIEDKPARYNDTDNSVGFESLAILESDGNYNHFDYFAGGETGLDGVMGNAAALFRRNAAVFVSPCWLDTARLRELEDDEFKKKFGSVPDRTQRSFIEIFDSIAVDWLRSLGMKSQTVSSHLAPYDPASLTAHIIYGNGRDTLEISQLDWRDDYTVYYADFNGKRLASVDTSSFPSNEAAAKALLTAAREKLSLGI
jgi:hypothetical protein